MIEGGKELPGKGIQLLLYSYARSHGHRHFGVTQDTVMQHLLRLSIAERQILPHLCIRSIFAQAHHPFQPISQRT
jgi:hypothetical protein